MNAYVMAAAVVDASPSSGEAVLFWVLAPLMVVAALGLLFAKKAVHAALSTALVNLSNCRTLPKLRVALCAMR